MTLSSSYKSQARNEFFGDRDAIKDRWFIFVVGDFNSREVADVVESAVTTFLLKDEGLASGTLNFKAAGGGHCGEPGRVTIALVHKDEAMDPRVHYPKEGAKGREQVRFMFAPKTCTWYSAILGNF